MRTHCVGPGCSFNMPLVMALFQKSWKVSSFRESFRRSRATAGRRCSFFTERAAIFNTSVNLPDNIPGFERQDESREGWDSGARTEKI